MEYTIQKLAQLAGITPRALRWYDKIGLLSPLRMSGSGYRIYGEAEVNRLQEILLYRAMGVPLKEISALLSENTLQRKTALAGHLDALRLEQQRLITLIQTVENTLTSLDGGYDMSDKDKFEGLKRNALEQNERKYGGELRQKHGEGAIVRSNKKWMNLTEHEYNEVNSLAAEIQNALEQAVTDGGDAAGELGRNIFEMHKRWLSYSWSSYSPEAHMGLAETYVSDERFAAYYDRSVPGCADFLRRAIQAHAIS